MGLNLGKGLAEPVRNEVDLMGHATLIKHKQIVNVPIAKFPPKTPAAQKRRIPHNKFRRRPLRLICLAFRVVAQNCISVLDVRQFLQNRLAIFPNGVLVLPLQKPFQTTTDANSCA